MCSHLLHEVPEERNQQDWQARRDCVHHQAHNASKRRVLQIESKHSKSRSRNDMSKRGVSKCSAMQLERQEGPMTGRQQHPTPTMPAKDAYCRSTQSKSHSNNDVSESEVSKV
jgi:hypothetical protein